MPDIVAPATPQEAADMAAEAIRTLNRLTNPPGSAYTNASDVFSVLSNIQLLTQRLPQALAQAQEALYRMGEAGVVYDDRNSRRVGYDPIDPMVTVETVALEMTAAAVHMRNWSAAIQCAVDHASHIGGGYSEEEDE